MKAWSSLAYFYQSWFKYAMRDQFSYVQNSEKYLTIPPNTNTQK